MPEGPEIRRAADRVAEAIVGRPAKDVYFAFDRLKSYEAQLTGATVTAVDTFGKAMVTRFDNDLNIYSHNQLYGRWMIRDAYDMPDTNRQLRLAIHNDEKSALLYSASEIAVLPTPELMEHPFLRRAGVDVLHEDVAVDQVAERFHDDRFRRRMLASLLLDQSFLAGLGNYLRSEILFVAGVFPRHRPADCSAEEIGALAEAAVQLPRRSYRTGGIVTPQPLIEEMKSRGMKRRDYRFWVFGRDEKPCYQCGTPIVRDEMGSRRIYYCPSCQPVRGG